MTDDIRRAQAALQSDAQELPRRKPPFPGDAPVQGLPVAGYRDQKTRHVALVNQNKVIEEHVLRQIDRHKADTEFDQRLVALAKTHIEIGFMLLNRGVFQPDRLTGDLPSL